LYALHARESAQESRRAKALVIIKTSKLKVVLARLDELITIKRDLFGVSQSVTECCPQIKVTRPTTIAVALTTEAFILRESDARNAALLLSNHRQTPV